MWENSTSILGEIVKAVITNSHYTLNPFKVHWTGRWEDGTKMRYEFDPPFDPYYFYKSSPESPIVKREVNLPPQINQERDGKGYYATYEADLNYAERVLFDLGVRKGVEIFDPSSTKIIGNYKPVDYSDIELRKSYIDIETDDTVPLNVEEPTGEVLSIAMRDSFKRLTVILTTIPKEKINTQKLMQLLRSENEKIRYALKERGLERLLKYVGNMDLQVVSVSSEQAMLESYQKYLNSPDSKNIADIQSGYNINAFDLPYLQNRADQQYKIKMGYRFFRGQYGEAWASHRNITNIDLYFAYMRLQENDLESFSLESVSQNEFGIGKVKHSMGYREMYENEPELFLVYNYRDTLLCHLLDLKVGISDFFIGLSNKAGTLDAGKWNATNLVDSLIFRKTHDMEFKVPTHRLQEKIKVEGGKVMEAKEGIFHNVAVLDFKHLYPNIMVQFNISPDTILLNDEIGPDDIYIGEFPGPYGQMVKVGFRKDIIGIIPDSIVELVRERYAVKNKMKTFPSDSDEYQILNNEQRSIKEVDNSFYGVNGSPAARLFNPYNQASITYIARENLMFVAEYVKNIITTDVARAIYEAKINRLLKKGFEILYGDTDSVFIWNPEWETMEIVDVVPEAKILNEMINSTFKEFVERFNANTDKIVLEMEFEKVYSVWEQWGGQKQYAGWIAWKDGEFLPKPVFDVKGFDPRRSDRSIYGSDYFMPTFLKLPLEDKEKAVEFYDMEAEKWERHEIDPEKIGIFFSLNKDDYTKSKNGGSTYSPKNAYNNAIASGIKLDRMKGKYRMYFVKKPKPKNVIAINYDDPVPKEILKNLDWEHHRKRCMDVAVVQKIMQNIRPSVEKESVDDYEVDD